MATQTSTVDQNEDVLDILENTKKNVALEKHVGYNRECPEYNKKMIRGIYFKARNNIKQKLKKNNNNITEDLNISQNT